MGATRDGCFLGKTNACEPPHLCHLPTSRAHNWPAGPCTSDCLPRLSSWPRGDSLVGARWPTCLWCCHLSWVCLRPSACWKCPPSHPCAPSSHEGPAAPFRGQSAPLFLSAFPFPAFLGLLWGNECLWFCPVRELIKQGLPARAAENYCSLKVSPTSGLSPTCPQVVFLGSGVNNRDIPATSPSQNVQY